MPQLRSDDRVIDHGVKPNMWLQRGRVGPRLALHGLRIHDFFGSAFPDCAEGALAYLCPSSHVKEPTATLRHRPREAKASAVKVFEVQTLIEMVVLLWRH